MQICIFTRLKERYLNTQFVSLAESYNDHMLTVLYVFLYRILRIFAVSNEAIGSLFWFFFYDQHFFSRWVDQNQKNDCLEVLLVSRWKFDIQWIQSIVLDFNRPGPCKGDRT